MSYIYENKIFVLMNRSWLMKLNMCSSVAMNFGAQNQFDKCINKLYVIK